MDVYSFLLGRYLGVHCWVTWSYSMFGSPFCKTAGNLGLDGLGLSSGSASSWLLQVIGKLPPCSVRLGLLSSGLGNCPTCLSALHKAAMRCRLGFCLGRGFQEARVLGQSQECYCVAGYYCHPSHPFFSSPGSRSSWLGETSCNYSLLTEIF